MVRCHEYVNVIIANRAGRQRWPHRKAELIRRRIMWLLCALSEGLCGDAVCRGRVRIKCFVVASRCKVEECDVGPGDTTPLPASSSLQYYGRAQPLHRGVVVRREADRKHVLLEATS